MRSLPISRKSNTDTYLDLNLSPEPFISVANSFTVKTNTCQVIFTCMTQLLATIEPVMLPSTYMYVHSFSFLLTPC